MNLEEGEPVGLSTGLQAGAFLGLYLGFSLAVISVLTDPTKLQRLAVLKEGRFIVSTGNIISIGAINLILLII